ncbi:MULTISPECIES: dicarboxylate/amino acid:cation symporter [unclassified Actinobaculum]|uniref:dicarboxylate/amino acid:cation symporter n=1 Tax=unclassified Actinobaculum TaxID=2609299 RepID=UPI000D52650F|nr:MULTISPECIES: dicarboxylate/amino acid:cation symporter [unclassified Actinobaculum]AWE41908.1 sodium:proton antiporter [Actinobaculum sp. 313]RTE50177.1 dicarboxylate/amino acid:cation symporter [Actinobaculum sp. 352]
MSTSSQSAQPASPVAEADAKARTWRRFIPSFSTQILISLVLAVLLGWAALEIGPTSSGTDNWLLVTLSTIGSSFVTLLRAVVPPLIFTAIVASIANLRGVANGAKLAAKTILWFAITALIAVMIGIILGLVLKPGTHTSVSISSAANPARTGSWLDFLDGIIPSNFLGISASSSIETDASGAISGIASSISFNALQLIVISIAIGVAALKVGKKAEPFLSFNESLLRIVQTVLWWIIRLAPLGTIGLLGNAVASYGWGSLASLGTFAIAVYLGLALVLFVVYPALLRLHGLNVASYFRGAWPAIQLGFVSRSSIGTMPVTERVTHRNLGVPRAYASFAVPLGSTTKMDGCASIYPAIAAIFVAQFFGVQLSITDYLLIAFVSVVGSAATAGVTGATVMLTLTLSTLGLPLEGVGLLLAIDPILDMGRTAVNVAGQALVPVIVAKREHILDEEKYRSATAEDLFADDASEETTDGVDSTTPVDAVQTH